MKLLHLAFFILITLCTHGQKQKAAIEVKPYIRWDWYPEFTYNVGGRPTTDVLKMQGTSIGFNINYKYISLKKYYFIAGLGYYKLSFDKLTNKNSLFGTSSSRDIDYPGMINIGWRTFSYHYNCVAANLGVGKPIQLNEKLRLATSVNAAAFFTFSQAYKIKVDNITYRTNNNRLFAYSFFINIGIEKEQAKKIQLIPKLLIPIADIWHEDKVFPSETPGTFENPSSQRNKWFRGIGFGISCNYSLAKK